MSADRLDVAVAADLVCSVIERRNTIPILSNMLVKAEEEGLRLQATDLDIEVSVVCSAATENFATTVDGKLFSDIVRSVGNVDNLHLEGTKLVMGTGPTFMLSTLPTDDFPYMTVMEPKVSFEIPARQLLADIQTICLAIGTEETRYYLTGANIETHEGKLSFAATDGHRCYIIERQAPEGAEALGQSIVPRKALRLVRAAIEALPNQPLAKLTFGHLKVQFEIGPVVINTKLIDGTFPHVRRVVPDNIRGTLSVQADELLACVKAAGLVRMDRAQHVALDFKAGLVRTKEVGSAEMFAVLPGARDGDLPEAIGFNIVYLIDICERFAGTEMKLGITDAAGPAKFTSDDSPLLAVLMPVRL